MKTIFLILIPLLFFSCTKKYVGNDINYNHKFGTGAIKNKPEDLARVPVYITKNGVYSVALLPQTFKLSMPPVGNQGGEGSCTAFSCGYYALSRYWYQKSGATSYDFATNIFSPEWLNDQIVSYCGSGASIIHALYFLQNTGDVRWATSPYDDSGCLLNLTDSQISEASKFKIQGYAQTPSSDITNIKNLLLGGKALIFQFSPDSIWFNGDGTPDFVWKTLGTPYSLHANCVVGWDDSKNAWLTINQYGTNWGDAGYRWIDYNFFSTDVATSLLFIQDTVAVTPPPPIDSIPPPPPSDITPPTVNIVNPTDGYKIPKSAKTINVSISASDNVAIGSVQILIDGRVVSNTYSYLWNVKGISRGKHIITANAIDSSKNPATTSITVFK